MLPVLFADTAFETPTYFALYLLAYLGAIILATRIAIRYKLSPVRAIDLGMFAFLFGFSGARIFHILVEAPSYYLEKPLRVFYFWQGGFVLYGGILIGIVGCYSVVRFWWKESTGRWGDVLAAPMLLGIGIGRMGCLAAGCCFGARTDWLWGIVFTNPRSGAPLHVLLHPTQLLEALFGFIAAGIFVWIYREPPKRKGEAWMMMLLAYSCFRFLIEYIRGDNERGFFFNAMFSTSQLIALALIFFVLLWKTFPKQFKWVFN